MSGRNVWRRPKSTRARASVTRVERPLFGASWAGRGGGELTAHLSTDEVPARDNYQQRRREWFGKSIEDRLRPAAGIGLRREFRIPTIAGFTGKLLIDFTDPRVTPSFEDERWTARSDADPAIAAGCLPVPRRYRSRQSRCGPVVSVQVGYHRSDTIDARAPGRAARLLANRGGKRMALEAAGPSGGIFSFTADGRLQARCRIPVLAGGSIAPCEARPDGNRSSKNADDPVIIRHQKFCAHDSISTTHADFLHFNQELVPPRAANSPFTGGRNPLAYLRQLWLMKTREH